MKDHTNKSLDNISKYVIYNKYARYLPEKQRRETWEEIIDRNKAMHLAKFPELAAEIEKAYLPVYEKKVLPSMRSLQFAGKAIETNPARMYNCTYAPIDHPYVFAEAMFLLLGGSGFGFSVQKRHISKLPVIVKPGAPQRFLIHDSIEGWADAAKRLLYAYFYGKDYPVFDFSDIRPKGSPILTAGGRAPGPDPLRICLERIDKILSKAIVGERLSSLQIHDILCHIADSVRSGGTRRSSMISFFDLDDEAMLTCKYGAWGEENPQREMANNSAVIIRGTISKEQFMDLWAIIKASGSGEPGVYFTNDPDMLANPCVEIGLNPHGGCNLTEVVAAKIASQEELNELARCAAFIGTLQASYTDFHYLRPQWRKRMEEEALLGVGLTGVASGEVFGFDITEAAQTAVAENIRVAKLIGINPAHRVTCVKPSGTASLVAKCSSGIHPWWSPYFIRRVRVEKTEAVYSYFKDNLPHFVEDENRNPENRAIISFPIKAPEGASYRDENPIFLLERVKEIHEKWIRVGHIKGKNTHNVSCTTNIKDHEWEEVGEWMWKNRDYYNGISAFPYDGGTYVQAPNEEITQEEYEALIDKMDEIDMSLVHEDFDGTDLVGEVACSGGTCERLS